MTFRDTYDRLLSGGGFILKIFLRGIQGLLVVGTTLLLGSSGSGINYLNNSKNSNLSLTLDLNAMAMKLENDIKTLDEQVSQNINDIELLDQKIDNLKGDLTADKYEWYAIDVSSEYDKTYNMKEHLINMVIHF